MIDIRKCPALDPEFEDPDGCDECRWETWRCRDAALAEVVRLIELERRVADGVPTVFVTRDDGRVFW